MNAFVLFALCSVVAVAKSDDFAANFTAIMIDDETEARLGAFPYDRKLYADAIDICARYKARAVVLKFFLDLPKSPEGDTALGNAMKKIPVALQARLDSSEGTAAIIPDEFAFGPTQLRSQVRGERGWIPLPSLLQAAAAVGFVDFDSAAIPLVEEYRGTPYRSLVVCCLELAAQATARTSSDDRVYIGNGYLPTDATGVYRADLQGQPPIKSISFWRLLGGEVKREEIEGRVVVIGWDSAKTPTVSTEHGSVRIHYFFLQCLAASFRDLLATQKP